MRIAIFHNFLDNIGGAEKVGLILARALKADVYTTNIDKEKIEKMGFGDILPRIHSIGRIPLNAPFRQQAALILFRFLNLKNKYDFFIIDGDWAMSGAVNNKPNLWYVHSPIREIWDLYKQTRNKTVPFYLRPIFDVWVLLNRYLNKKYLKQVDLLVCNSDNTKERIVKYFCITALVIHPPVETKKYVAQTNGDYWLSVNRLITHKRIEFQLEAFRMMPDQKLIIVGSYEQSRHFLRYAKSCLELRPNNVEIKSWVDETELLRLYANCRGLITTSHDEDFGMCAVEAMASGKPVIAPDEGGYKESVVNNETGILIEGINAQKICDAVRNVNNQLATNPNVYLKKCQKRSKEFDADIFVQKIMDIINSHGK